MSYSHRRFDRGMRRPVRHQNTTLPDGCPVKITLGEMRVTGVLLAFCADHRCSHNVTLEPAYVDR